jgi:dienelactone hydrolase
MANAAPNAFGAQLAYGPKDDKHTVEAVELLLRGVVSLHGTLDSPLPAEPGAIKSKILVLHGDEDPVASLESIMRFREEMRLARANWEINIYGDARHSFTGEGVVGGKRRSAAGDCPPSRERGLGLVLLPFRPHGCARPRFLILNRYT